MENEAGQTEKLVREISQPLSQAAGWIKFMGIALIIYGSLLGLTIIGLLIAWLPFWLGLVLLKAGNNAKRAFHEGDKGSLIQSLLNLNTYFTINAMLIILGLAMVILAFIILLVTGFAFNQLYPDTFV
ncbi:MAG: DUF5362 domain-containing protein [Bacteroidetes bacterium]|nr:DUF5362 domain-containing protein [Bacteroidota bacterium]